MKKRFNIVVASLCVVFGWAQKPVFTQASLESARVYYNSAELTHKASVNLPKGTSEVVISNVADYLNDGTIQIGATNNVTVMSVQFSNRFIEEYDAVADSPLIKPVKDSIRLVEVEVAKLNNKIATQNKTIELLDANQKVGTTQGSSVVELTKMVDYYQTKRNQLANEVDVLTEKSKNLKLKLASLKDRLAFNEGKSDKVSKGKVILQVMSENAGTTAFQIKYLTQSASWKPFYDLRVDQINTPVKVMYKADVKQNSGVDWRNVKLSLTSGLANQSNVIPEWNIWFVDYAQANSDSKYNAKQYRVSAQASYDNLVSSKISAEKGYFEETTLNDFTSVNESQLNVSFDISIPYTIVSNGKGHSVSLNTFSIPAEYKYYAAPKLDLNAYLVATVKDYANYNLLAGDANVIFDGVYVGKTHLDPSNTEEQMKLNMGKDPRIVLTRTLLKEKSGTKLLSSRKAQNFEYDIAIRNTKAEPIVIQIEDQYPISSNKDIEIELTAKAGATIDTEKGLLKWDLKLKANESKTLRFGYEVKSNKDQTVYF